jgi:hydrogenase-4 component B
MILHLAYSAILLSLASAVFALLQSRFKAIVFVLLGLSGVSAIAAGIGELLDQTVLIDKIPLGLPWQAWHIRFDGLSAFFFLIIGIAVFVVSFYAPTYTRNEQKDPQSFAVLSLFTGLFIAGMMLVLLADDAFMFMIAWELSW